MTTIQSVIELIGNTPLLDISHMAKPGSARVVAKLEMMNPGSSIKDRPALAMISDAEERGELKPGMTIVEPTAGNTGIGLALVGNLKGYKTVFFVPDRMSAEKICAMKLLGAKVCLVPKEKGMVECIQLAQNYCDEHGNCYMPQQFINPSNYGQAEKKLGAEILRQLGDYPDALAIGAGTGGTFTGLSRWLKKGRSEAFCLLVEPEGSIFQGKPKGPYLVEGIGNSFIPDTLDLSLADGIVDVPDRESFAMVKRAAMELGLLLGGSSGANMYASLQLAAKLGEGKTILTVFPDSLERYSSKDWVTELVQ